VPPLRERREDIALLADSILARLARENALKSAPELEPEALERLAAYDFPGNVRELENILERAVTLSDGKRITAAELQLRRRSDVPVPVPREPLSLPGTPGTPLGQHVEEVEKRAIEEALQKTSGNKTRAAALLGMTFRQLRYKVKKLGIKVNKLGVD